MDIVVKVGSISLISFSKLTFKGLNASGVPIQQHPHIYLTLLLCVFFTFEAFISKFHLYSAVRLNHLVRQKCFPPLYFLLVIIHP